MLLRNKFHQNVAVVCSLFHGFCGSARGSGDGLAGQSWAGSFTRWPLAPPLGPCPWEPGGSAVELDHIVVGRSQDYGAAALRMGPPTGCVRTLEGGS